MEGFLEKAKECMKELNLCDLAMVKLGALALGLIIGLAVPKKCKSIVFLITFIVFALISIPSIMKCLKSMDII